METGRLGLPTVCGVESRVSGTWSLHNLSEGPKAATEADSYTMYDFTRFLRSGWFLYSVYCMRSVVRASHTANELYIFG